MVTLTVGVRAKEGNGGGGGEKKKIRLPDIIVLLGNSVRWPTELLIGAAQGSELMPVNFKTVNLYCLFRFRQSFGIGAAENVACITQ